MAVGYPVPAGASAILGLEASGVVKAVGKDVTSVSVGDRVMALLEGWSGGVLFGTLT